MPLDNILINMGTSGQMAIAHQQLISTWCTTENDYPDAKITVTFST